MALTPKQKRFVAEYLVDLNATAAAKRAGYSEKTACEQAARLLANVKVQTAVQEAMQARQQRTEITQDYVIGKLKEIADKDASDAQDSDLRYSSKIKALELLGKHVGAFEKKPDQKTAALETAMRALADIIEKPVRNRKIEDFEA